MPNIAVLYDVGDTVYVVVTRKSCTPVACSVCGSTGKVTISENEYTCPECGGRTQAVGGTERVVESMVVSRILAQKAGSTPLVKYEGVRSGSRAMTIEERSVFATEAEAQASIV